MEKCATIYGHLNSHRHYSRLDSPQEIIHSYRCNEENGEIYKDRLFKNLCYKFATNFTYLIIDWGNYTDDEGCYYLNLWIYDKLINNFDINQEDISQSNIIKDIDNLWNKYSEDFPKCKFKNYKITVSEFKNMKYLYDYYQNYDTLKHRSDTSDLECKKYYCSYIKQIRDVYGTVKGKCSSNNNTELCAIFNLIKNEKKPDNLFTEANCSSELVDNSLIQEVKSSGKDLEDTLVFQESYTSKNSPADIALKAFFSLFGVSLISSFLAYRYTPFGNWFRIKILKKNGFGNILHADETEELLHNNSEIEDTIFEKDLNVTFHPMTSS
ncbi:PIR Superfamily Protein [Plasmodium ovale curtisi]|uniref:PIR Superfamily Protein n=1 Tax=Plasmodium ovale curtisi TaxID=864141 RepID=A0A1A8WI78_PLAOA|nr:PIR Superfamily Protein [Plasmodium ovale curtisi]